MNKQRRKEIDEAKTLVDEVKSKIEDIQNEEQDYYDNMPENMQSGEKGDAAQQVVDALGNAVTDLETVISYLEEATSN